MTGVEEQPLSASARPDVKTQGTVGQGPGQGEEASTVSQRLL